MKPLTNEEFIKRMKKIQPDLIFDKTKYINRLLKVIITCPYHGDKIILPSRNLNRKVGCPDCEVNKLTIDKISEKINKIYNGNIKFEKGQIYKNNKEEYYWTCLKHKITFLKRADSVLQGHGCKECHKEILRKKFTRSINSIQIDIDNVYGKNVYKIIGREKNNIIIKCLGCGNEFTKTTYDFLKRKSQCICKTVSYEKKCKNILQKFNNIEEIEIHKTFSNLKDKKSLSYDFYIKKYNLLIEINGPQHYYNIYHKNLHDFHKQLHHDWIKRKYAKNNNINLLVIPYFCFENIDEIISSLYI
jgi:hypothetical protein